MCLPSHVQQALVRPRRQLVTSTTRLHDDVDDNNGLRYVNYQIIIRISPFTHWNLLTIPSGATRCEWQLLALRPNPSLSLSLSEVKLFKAAPGPICAASPEGALHYLCGSFRVRVRENRSRRGRIASARRGRKFEEIQFLLLCGVRRNSGRNY